MSPAECGCTWLPDAVGWLCIHAANQGWPGRSMIDRGRCVAGNDDHVQIMKRVGAQTWALRGQTLWNKREMW